MTGFSAAMRYLMDDVRDFQETVAGFISPLEPITAPGHSLIRLRAKLIVEECTEILCGMFDTGLSRDQQKQSLREIYDEIDMAPVKFDLEAVADGLADLIYVCVGAALSFGVPLDRVWAEVQRANMDKLGGPKRESDGKQLKPAGWIGPRIREAIFGEAA